MYADMKKKNIQKYYNDKNDINVNKYWATENSIEDANFKPVIPVNSDDSRSILFVPTFL